MLIQNSATATRSIMIRPTIIRAAGRDPCTVSNSSWLQRQSSAARMNDCSSGIRVLLFVNTSDYMSTSESSGVRLAIHSPTENPFPDTFGYSAPVGFASSFGLKKVEYILKCAFVIGNFFTATKFSQIIFNLFISSEDRATSSVSIRRL